MSTASKITFGITCALSAVTIIGVYQYQEREREVWFFVLFNFYVFLILSNRFDTFFLPSQAIRQGPIRDAERMRRKAEEELTNPSAPVLTPQQEARRAEYELQKRLQQQYEQVQAIDSDKTSYGPDKKQWLDHLLTTTSLVSFFSFPFPFVHNLCQYLKSL